MKIFLGQNKQAITIFTLVLCKVAYALAVFFNSFYICANMCAILFKFACDKTKTDK